MRAPYLHAMGASYLRANPAAPPQTLQAIERRCILALRRPPAEDGLPCLRHADKAPSAQCGHSPSSVIAKSSPTRRRRCARSTTAHAPPGGGHGAQQHAAAGNRTLSSSKRGPTSLSSSSEKKSLGLVGPFAVGPAARACAPRTCSEVPETLRVFLWIGGASRIPVALYRTQPPGG